RPTQNRFQQGDVLVEDLILQGFGARGNKQTLPVQQSREKVRQSFAGSRSRLDDDVALGVQSIVNRFSNADLRRAEFVVAQFLLQYSTRAEELVHGPLSVYFRTLV